MKTEQKKPTKSSLVPAIAVAAVVLAAGGTWLALRGGDAPRSSHPATPAEAARAQAQADRSAPTKPLAAPLPTRQLKLGDSFTYHIDSSRQLAEAAPPKQASAPTSAPIPAPAAHN